MSKYKKALIAKLRRQIAFKKEQGDDVAVDLLENKILEIELQMQEKALRKEKIKHLSDPPKYAFIHKVADLKKCCLMIMDQKPKAIFNSTILAFNVWAKQNPNLAEYYTPFIDFAEALIQGYYVPFEDIAAMREEIIKEKPSLLNTPIPPDKIREEED